MQSCRYSVRLVVVGGHLVAFGDLHGFLDLVRLPIVIPCSLLAIVRQLLALHKQSWFGLD